MDNKNGSDSHGGPPGSFNSVEVAKFLGVNVSSIKRWTDQGKLECIKTPGGHRRFLLTHIAKFIEEHRKKASKINLFPIEDEADMQIASGILKEDLSILQHFFEQYALTGNRKRAQKVLSGLYLSHYPLYKIFDELLTPVLHHIGELWAEGEIAILEEHLASNTIYDSICRLQGIIKIPEATRGQVLCLSLSGEEHLIALKMVDFVLEEQGFQVFNSGSLPAMLFRIEDIFEKLRPKRLYLSSTIVSDLLRTQKELEHLFALCEKYQAHAYVGGRGFDQLVFNHPVVVKRLETFEELTEI